MVNQQYVYLPVFIQQVVPYQLLVMLDYRLRDQVVHFEWRVLDVRQQQELMEILELGVIRLPNAHANFPTSLILRIELGEFDV